MAVRPWVTPEEVRAYSDREEIADRTDARLAVDITRAETYVISYTNNDFSDSKKYLQIPNAVKTAVILLAEHYGYTARKGLGGMKSETYDDYSYTAAEGTLVDLLDLGPLLDEYAISAPSSGVTLKIRKL